MFGERLKQLRTEKGLFQKELAKILGVSAGAIGMYENGKRTPDFEILNKIADYFNVSVDYLLGRTDIRAQIKDKYTGAELVDLVPDEWKPVIKEIDEIIFKDKIKKSDIKPEDLIIALKTITAYKKSNNT